jgi:hypothetical protein
MFHRPQRPQPPRPRPSASREGSRRGRRHRSSLERRRDARKSGRRRSPRPGRTSWTRWRVVGAAARAPRGWPLPLAVPGSHAPGHGAVADDARPPVDVDATYHPRQDSHGKSYTTRCRIQTTLAPVVHSCSPATMVVGQTSSRESKTPRHGHQGLPIRRYDPTAGSARRRSSRPQRRAQHRTPLSPPAARAVALPTAAR